MIIIGLTGSIAMGKSTVARMLLENGVPVFCADQAVHKLMGDNGAAVEAVARVFPDSHVGTKIDRYILGQIIFGDGDENEAERRRDVLESILHPMVQQEEAWFLARQRRMRRDVVALDIPLLFEAGRADDMDIIWVVTAPKSVQMARALKRSGMGKEKLRAILEAQMPDAQKRLSAHHLIYTSLGFGFTRRQVMEGIRQARAKASPCVK